MSVEPFITLDVDWAPDFAIDFVANLLIESKVRATWFITHESPAIERLREHPYLFELGIHPNFLPGSTHGKSDLEVLKHCMSLVPQARVVRTHGLVQSSNLLEMFVDQTPIRLDVSLFLPHASALAPVTYYWENGKRLIRLPYVWEDDFEMVRPNSNWDLEKLFQVGSGLMIMDFHPIHIFLNSSTLAPYRAVRSGGQLGDLSEQHVSKYIQVGYGAGYAFQSALNYMKDRHMTNLESFLE